MRSKLWMWWAGWWSWLCMPFCLLAQTELPITRIVQPLEGQGIEQRLSFGTESGSSNVLVQAAYTVGADFVLLVGSEEAQADRLPLHMLLREENFGQVSWRGWHAGQASVSILPDYWVMRPLLAQWRQDSLLLVLELADEESIGLLFLGWKAGQSFLEQFVSIAARDAETGYRTAPQFICTWEKEGFGLQVSDPMVCLEIADQKSYLPGDWWKLVVTPFGLHMVMRQDHFQKLPKSDIQYAAMDRELVLLLQGSRVLRPQQTQKAAQAIAQTLQLPAFDLVRGYGGVSAYYLRDGDAEHYQPAWEQHWLGRWENGKWKPAPPLK
jgi:hypothetical protein